MDHLIVGMSRLWSLKVHERVIGNEEETISKNSRGLNSCIGKAVEVCMVESAFYLEFLGYGGASFIDIKSLVLFLQSFVPLRVVPITFYGLH